MPVTVKAPSTLHTGAGLALGALRRWVEARDFAGYDPYDALTSPILRVLSFRTKWGRIAAIQALKRCPVNLRPALLIRPGHNPKALGLFLESYAKLGMREHVARLLDVLAATRSTRSSGHGWGYNFDWQSRAFFAPKGTPNIVCSSFIGHALLDAYESFSEQRALDLAVPISDFILGDLNRTVERETFCFSYTPLDRYAVHNANLLGASLLIRLHAITGDANLRNAALPALAYSMKCQREDGSWFYSERPGSHWIDSFHTGFNLESIRRFLDAGEGTEYRSAYQAGVRFYRQAFFLSNGTPKYYHDRVYPIDVHSAAEAISFLSCEPDGGGELTRRVLGWTIDNMLDPRGFFYSWRGKAFTVRIPYMRWAEAWMFRALSHFAARSLGSSPLCH